MSCENKDSFDLCVAVPLGKAWEKFMPDWRFSVLGNVISLNPGHFTKKEHMLITIMANVGFNVPYTNYIGKINDPMETQCADPPQSGHSIFPSTSTRGTLETSCIRS